jgi:kinesin family protein 2/24
MAMISHGMNIRTTAATGVHDASSRSHAILRIYIQRNDIVNKGAVDKYNCDNSGVVEGTLTLVDLAGSEHRIDSMYHGKERRKETGNINASLMALKECIRARAAGKNLSHQYRKSKLTMALKTSFSLSTARTIVIATVSPASKGEH